MPKSTLKDVSDTALWVASYRADESFRSDALFHDPLAAKLAGERGKEIAKKMEGSRYVAWSVVIRTRIIDSYILELLPEGIDTVLNLGAGLDTRPYRLDLPASLRWIEADFSHMVSLKNEQLADEKPKCRLERVGVDLSNAKARGDFLAQVNSSSKKILVLTEGVIPYLTNDQVSELAQDLRRQSNIRFWISEYFSPNVMKYMRSKKRLKQMKNAPFQFEPTDWFAFFRSLGWKVRMVRYTGEESEKLGRAIPLPWWATVLRFIFRAKDHPQFKQFTGYVLLE